METKLLEAIASGGPWYALAVMLFAFLVKYVWPWFIGPHQDNLQSRWQAGADSERARDDWVREVMEKMLTMSREYQNGWRSASHADHQEILAKIAQLQIEVRQLIDNGPQRDTVEGG